jgi:hypothetical protein
MQEHNMGDDSTSNGGTQGRGGNRLLVSLILAAILLIILVVGFLVVDTIMQLRQPVVGGRGAVATQVQQVINPTPTIIADPETIIRQVQALARLETASYTVEKVITAESGEGAFGFLFRDELLLVAQGQVIAGIDLARMGEGDVRVAGDTVFVTVPAAEVFVSTLDNDATYVYDRRTGLLGQQIDLETLARQEAEQEILSAALEDGILDMAEGNAEIYLTGLMYALGFEEVVFVNATPAPDQNMGE